MVPVLIFGVLNEIGWGKIKVNWQQFYLNTKKGIPLLGEFLFDFLYNMTDRYLILFFFTISAVGEYQIVMQISSLLLLFPKLLGTVLTPQLSRLFDKAKYSEAYALVDKCIDLHFLLTLPFIIGAMFMGPTLINLISATKLSIAQGWSIVLLPIGMSFYGLYLIICHIAFVTGHNGSVQAVNIYALLVKLGFSVFLLSMFNYIDILGLVVCVSSILTFYLAIRTINPYWKFTFSRWNAVKVVISCIPMVFIMYYLDYRLFTSVQVEYIKITYHIIFLFILYFSTLHLLEKYLKPRISYFEKG